MAKKQKENVFSSQYPSGIAFVGLILLGTGIGMLVGYVGAGSVIGVGLGFLAVAVMSGSDKNKRLNR